MNKRDKMLKIDNLAKSLIYRKRKACQKGRYKSRLWYRSHNIETFSGNFNMQNSTDEMSRIFIMNSLESNGICVIDDYLDLKSANSIALTTRQIYQYIPGLFTEALPHSGVMYRDDLTCWVKGNEIFCKSFNALNQKLTLLMQHLRTDFKLANKLLKLSHKSRFQVACFPAGSFGYKPHFDNPNKNGRVLSVIFFPNEDYVFETHGGVSRFFVNDKRDCIDVAPIFNRLVLYWSDQRVVTETLPAYENVFALSCWYFGTHST